jgi:ATP-dependent RNA helicase DeaD
MYMKTCSDRVPDALARTLIAHGFQTLTPVQRAVLRAGYGDMLVSAPTGSGKTLAFGLALADDLIAPDGSVARAAGPLALVITPTRELARQVCDELSWLYGATDARILRCTGGSDLQAEQRALASGVDMVAGSPGRLRDHAARGTFDMAGLRAIVLDEADDMLDLGFRDDLEFILGAAPRGCRVLMFSATITPTIEALAARYQTAARRIDTRVTRDGAVDILHEAILAVPGVRDSVITNVLRYHDARAAIVFCGRREAVAQLAARLAERGFPVVSLSGALPQRERDAAFAALRDGRARVCVATDLAARGFDLPGLDLVIHADLPPSRAALIHRSGRTGRAGRQGRSVLIVPPGTRRRAEALTAEAGIGLQWIEPPCPDTVARRDAERALEDPVLRLPLEVHERALVERLLAAHDPERVAAAYLRLRSAGRPEPLAIAAGGSRSSARGRWFRMTSQAPLPSTPAEARALVCRCGDVGPGDVGRIRVGAREIRFEIAGPASAGFVRTLSARPPETVVIAPLSGGRRPRRDTAAG